MRNRRADILDAALEAFTVHGYSATSMSDLRRTTGASTGSLYHHFPSKEHLAAALYLEALEDFQAGFAAAIESAPDARAGIEAGVRFHLGWVGRHPRRARLLATELEPAVLPLVRERLEHLNGGFLGRVGTWYDAAVAAGELERLPGEALYALWVGPAQELARRWLAGRAKTGLAEMGDALAEGAWKALRTGGTRA